MTPIVTKERDTKEEGRVRLPVSILGLTRKSFILDIFKTSRPCGRTPN